MAKKNTEEIKNKLVVKLFTLRRKSSAIKDKRRFYGTVRRVKNYENEYKIMAKRSVKYLIIGRDLSFDFDMQQLYKMDLEELKEYV